jgi:hypothetical protein
VNITELFHALAGEIRKNLKSDIEYDPNAGKDGKNGKVDLN